MTTSTTLSEHTQLPLLPLRDVVVFPHMVIPLFVGRPKSIKALEAAMEQGKSIMLAAQKAAAKDEPSADDNYEIGCVANILQMLKLPDGTVENWAFEAGTPNVLFRRGFTRKSLLPGTVVLIDGYRAKDGSRRANGRDLTFEDGKKLFMGSSGTGAPYELNQKPTPDR